MRTEQPRWFQPSRASEQDIIDKTEAGWGLAGSGLGLTRLAGHDRVRYFRYESGALRQDRKGVF